MRDSDLNVVHIFHEMTNWLKFLSDCDNMLTMEPMTGVAASRANTTGSPDYLGREVRIDDGF